VRRYLDILEGVFMVRQLKPWHENLKKRQVKSPKIYFRDSGPLHQILGIRAMTDLLLHPKCGASWEGYILEEVLATDDPDEAFFWATHAGAELDLLLFKGNRRIGIEIKRADAPGMTPSMRTAMTDLGLERLLVICPGQSRYSLARNIDVLPISQLSEGLNSTMNISEWLDKKESEGIDVSNIVLPEDLAKEEEPDETIFLRKFICAAFSASAITRLLPSSDSTAGIIAGDKKRGRSAYLQTAVVDIHQRQRRRNQKGKQ
jgi:hypothetical protein